MVVEEVAKDGVVFVDLSRDVVFSSLGATKVSELYISNSDLSILMVSRNQEPLDSSPLLCFLKQISVYFTK